MSRSLHLPTRILKVYIDVLIGFSDIFSPDHLNTLLSQDCVLEEAPPVGTVGKLYIPRTREKVSNLQWPSPVHR